MSLNNVFPSEVISGGVWIPSTIDQEPEVVLRNWRIYEVTFENDENDKSRHFVGKNVAGGGRVSSAIIEFDKDKMIGKTRSGRVYKLEGRSGMDMEASYVWNIWKRHNQVTSFVDVSGNY